MKAFDAIGRVFDAIGGFETVLKAIGAILAGKVLLGFASFSGSLLTLSVSFAKLIPLVIKVGASFAGMLGPIGLIVAAVGTAAGLIIANWDSIGPKVKAVWEKVQEWTAEKLTAIKEIWATVMRWAANKVQALKDVFSAAGELIAGVWRNLCYRVKTTWEGASDWDFRQNSGASGRVLSCRRVDRRNLELCLQSNSRALGRICRRI